MTSSKDGGDAFNYDLGGQDATLELPSGVEVDIEQKVALVGYGLQLAILEGKTRVTKRVWPCLYCGNRTFGSQNALIKHFVAHKETGERIKKWLESLAPNPAEGELK